MWEYSGITFTKTWRSSPDGSELQLSILISHDEIKMVFTRQYFNDDLLEKHLPTIKELKTLVFYKNNIKDDYIRGLMSASMMADNLIPHMVLYHILAQDVWLDDNHILRQLAPEYTKDVDFMKKTESMTLVEPIMNE